MKDLKSKKIGLNRGPVQPMLRKDDVQNMYIFKKAHTKLQTISSQFPEVAAL